MITIHRKNLSFVGFDDWCRAVYQHKSGQYFKDVTLKGDKDNIPDILNSSADGTFDGEPDYAVRIVD